MLSIARMQEKCRNGKRTLSESVSVQDEHLGLAGLGRNRSRA